VKTTIQRSGFKGMTLVEALAVVLVLGLLTAVILSALGRTRMRTGKITCVNCLRAMGLSFRIFEEDNAGRFPMQLSTNDGGSMEFVDGPFAFRHFQVMSNELSTPRILLCSSDKTRRCATNFGADFNSNSKISYLVGVDAATNMANMLLSGDRNIQSDAKLQRGILVITTNQYVRWTKEIHRGNGNVLLLDGSVQQLTSAALNGALKGTGVATNRLAIP